MNLLSLGSSLFFLIITFRPITLFVISSSHSIDAPSMTMLFSISVLWLLVSLVCSDERLGII